MSSVSNVLCPICSEEFHKDDDIHCTSCGHVLHYRCMEQGRIDGSTDCPQCDRPNPSTHKLYLHFGKSSEAAENIDELKAVLVESQQKFSRLKDDLVFKEDEIQMLSSEYTNKIELRRKECDALKENVACLEEKNLYQSHEIKRLSKVLAALKSSTDETIELRNEITANQLKEVVSSPSKDIPDTTPSLCDTTIIKYETEIKKLRNDLENSSILLAEEVSKNAQLSLECMHLKAKCSTSKEDNGEQIILVNEKNKVLEQKLKLLTTEFQKELKKSSQFEIDNMESQNYVVDSMKLNTTSVKQQQESEHHLSNIRNMQNFTFTSSSESINSRQGGNKYYFDSSSNSIIIQKYPVNMLQYPLENVVALIASNMGIGFSQGDINKVNMVKRKSGQRPELISLFVRFKTKELKNIFLANKSRLMVSALKFLTTVQIVEYIDDRVQQLLAYANVKLKGSVFNHIFWTNNQVFVKRNSSDPKGIRILNCQQVDDLLQKSQIKHCEFHGPAELCEACIGL